MSRINGVVLAYKFLSDVLKRLKHRFFVSALKRGHAGSVLEDGVTSKHDFVFFIIVQNGALGVPWWAKNLQNVSV